MTQTTGGMTLSEIEAEGEKVLESLTRMAEAIKPCIQKEFSREDPARLAFDAIGGARGPVRRGLKYWRRAIDSV